ncbi:MAG: metallophosphoesterase [bacterium]
MKIWNFIIFITIVLAVYFGVNFYIYKRGLQAIPAGSPLKTYYIILFVLFAASFWIGRILERFYLSTISEVFVWIGSFWLAYIAYLVLGVLLLDILRLCNQFIGFFPEFLTRNYAKTKFYTAIIVLAVSTIVIFLGFLNARNPRIKTLELTLPKKASSLNELSITMASDIHMGTIISNGWIRKIVNGINSTKPDIILLPGDIIDEDLAPVIKKNMGEELKSLKAKYGVFGITGNHEYIGGAAAAVKYLEEHNIKIIRDSSVVIDSSFTIVGREDRSINQFSGKTRKNLAEIMKNVDKTIPIILMDHQPFGLPEAQNNGIDLQLSGHTHHGQLFPFNFITEMIYEVSWGYKQKGNTQYYVSCGAGGWGPPVRTGSTPEIVNIKIKFTE